MSATDPAKQPALEGQQAGPARHAEDERRWREWMSAAQRGERDAYRKLLEELTAVIRSFLLARLGDVPVLDDCVQESLLGVHRARHTYDPGRAFRPWLFAIVRHKAVDALRRGAVREARESALPDEELRASPTATERSDLALDAERVLAGIDPRNAQALVLTKFHGYSIDEAASRAGVSRSAMKTRVHRGIRQVRKLLEKDDT